jgi:multifunctional beta-oxidation protein
VERFDGETVGGQAAPIVASVEDGQKVIQGCVDAFGTVHVVVNNAGILRDKSFAAMTEKEWCGGSRAADLS